MINIYLFVIFYYLNSVFVSGVEESANRQEADSKFAEMKKKNPNLEKLSFKPPNLTDEDHHSQHMPFALKCDGCMAIAYEMVKVFEEFNNKHPSMKKNLPTSDIIILVEKVCNYEYEEYGVKEVDGVKRLSGPAIPSTSKTAGMIQGGGKWPPRIQQMCKILMGELGEEEIYEIYKNGDDLSNWLCKGKDIRNACLYDNDKLEKAKKKAAKSKKKVKGHSKKTGEKVERIKWERNDEL
ncbi:unnamed protein product [Gordionus sp. m RMFG-2023]|uniref:marginal zone B- and B1-cell-specific protein-like n=1 Tax=Gordionus sp. m RMFG-2023 TaxID=3053472 RepID=UPI0030DE5437